MTPIILTWLTLSYANAAVSIMHMLTRTPCELELGDNGNGRYYRLISEQFPPGIVRSQVGSLGQPPNIECICTSRSWMVCTIRVLAGSIEEQLVRRKLDRRHPERLRPFFIKQMPGRLRSPIIFRAPQCMPPVDAEIVVINEGSAESEPPELARSDSAPGALHHPSKFIPLSVCIGGSPDSQCPIQLTPFRAGDIVYVLKSQEDKVKHGQYTPCISAPGLRKWASTDEARRRGGFMDPLKREGESILTIRNHYAAYIVYNDSEVSDAPVDNIPVEDRSLVEGSSSAMDAARAGRDAGSPDPGTQERQDPSPISQHPPPSESAFSGHQIIPVPGTANQAGPSSGGFVPSSSNQQLWQTSSQAGPSSLPSPTADMYPSRSVQRFRSQTSSQAGPSSAGMQTMSISDPAGGGPENDPSAGPSAPAPPSGPTQRRVAKFWSGKLPKRDPSTETRLSQSSSDSTFFTYAFIIYPGILWLYIFVTKRMHNHEIYQSLLS